MSHREINRLEAMQRLQAGGLTQADVSRQLGISVRQVKRIWRRYRTDGAQGLVSKRRGSPGNHRTDPTLLAQALDLIAQQYADFGPTLASEKLAERDGIAIPRETLRTAMIGAGLWKARRSRKKRTHPPRERRACRGELVQIDGSSHRWFEERAPKCTLLVFIDDATSQLMGLRFVSAETTQNYFDLVDEYIRLHGKPLAFYSDRFGVFRVNIATQNPEALTQFGRAMKELDIQSICASSPQAKGRVERANGVLQDRLVKELRLRNISSIEAANAFAPVYIAAHNHRFAVAPRCDIDAHRGLTPDLDLDKILCLVNTRVVSTNLTVQYGAGIFEITEPGMSRRLRCSRVIVREHRNGTITIEREGKSLSFHLLIQNIKQPRIVDSKTLELHSSPDRHVPNPRKAHPTPPNHPWLKTPRRSTNPSGDFSIGPDGDILPIR